MTASMAEEISPRMRRRVSSSTGIGADGHDFFSGRSYEIPLAGGEDDTRCDGGEQQHQQYREGGNFMMAGNSISHRGNGSPNKTIATFYNGTSRQAAGVGDLRSSLTIPTSSSRFHNSTSTTTGSRIGKMTPDSTPGGSSSLSSGGFVSLSSEEEEEEELVDFNDQYDSNDEDEDEDDDGNGDGDADALYVTTQLQPLSPTGSTASYPTYYDGSSDGSGSPSSSSDGTGAANPQSPTQSENKQQPNRYNSRNDNHQRKSNSYYAVSKASSSAATPAAVRMLRRPVRQQQQHPSLRAGSEHSIDSLSSTALYPDEHGSSNTHSSLNDCWKTSSGAHVSTTTTPVAAAKHVFEAVQNGDASVVGGRQKISTLLSMAVMAFCVFGFVLYSNARSSLRFAVHEVNQLAVFSNKLHEQLTKADHDMKMLHRQLEALDSIEQKREDDAVEERVLSQSSAFANPKLVEEMTTIQQKLKTSKILSEKLKKRVVELNRRDAEAKYGSGVIRVQMEVVFLNEEADKNAARNTNDDGHAMTRAGAAAASAASSHNRHIVVMEMAPLELMPHSVYTFLEMVSNGLLNGCSFILNAMHELKAAPLPYDGSPPHEKARAFFDHGLESVAFREYSPDFPHEQYTVGFAADGSPSFYINTEDNSAVHVGEPCFAKVVSGHDVVKRMNKMPTRNGIWLEQRIGIKEVTIL